MNFKPLKDYIDNVLIKEKQVPGCDIQIMKEHEVLFRYSAGFSDYDRTNPVSNKDLYFMYSCTKPLTCAAALQLVEKGIVGLDDEVGDYLPQFKNVFLLKDGEKVAPKHPMTIRHLFTMSGGLDYELNAPAIKEVIDTYPLAGTIDIINALPLAPLHFEPGELFSYSLCHDVLAGVIEVASGMKFSQYLKANIWEPLGMTRTGFVVPQQEKANLAAQYEYIDEKVCPVPQTNPYYLAQNYESGGAGLYSCVDDYALFVDAMANGGTGKNGKQILKGKTIDLMHSNQLGTHVRSTAFGCPAGDGYSYGLGVRTLVDNSKGQRSPIGEFGWDGAAGSYILIDPKNKVSIIYSMHLRRWTELLQNGHQPIRDLTYDCLGL